MQKYIPYGQQAIDESDIEAVIDVLRSDWLTTGPMVERFEAEIAQFVDARHAVAVSSGTAALHAMMFALGIGPGDEVVVPPMTFAATANAVVYQGGSPVFADVDPETLLLDPLEVEKKITRRTRAILAVDYAGQPCDYDALQQLADYHDLTLLSDGCHSLGASLSFRMCGCLAEMKWLSPSNKKKPDMICRAHQFGFKTK
jgi:perosamine synthetase